MSGIFKSTQHLFLSPPIQGNDLFTYVPTKSYGEFLL